MSVTNLAKAESPPQATGAVATRRISLQRQQQIWGWVFIAPWIIGFMVFTFLPIVASLIFSFTNFRLTRPDEIAFVGFANWARLLTDPILHTSIEVTMKFAVIALPLSIILPVALAALLNSPWLIGKPFFRTLFYMPYMVPIVSATYIWGGMLNTETGWINRILISMGVPGPNWLYDATWIYPALNIIGLWGVGNAMLITLASMQGVPTELYEAARIDGANALAQFRKITLPLISPVIFYNLVLSIIGIFRYFEVPYILKEGTGDPGNATMFINIHFYKTAFSFQDMGYGATLAWVIFLMAFVATLIVFLTSRYWVYYATGDNF